MRRSVALIAALLLLISAVSPALAAGTRMKVTVTARLIRNDHVGNEWTLNTVLNNKTIFDRVDPDHSPYSATVTLSKGDRLTLKTTIRDGEKYPDTSEDTTTRTLSASDIRSGFALTVRLVVKEDKGRYKGNTATWEITYEFRP